MAAAVCIASGCLDGAGFLASGFKGQLTLVVLGEPQSEHDPPPDCDQNIIPLGNIYLADWNCR